MPIARQYRRYLLTPTENHFIPACQTRHIDAHSLCQTVVAGKRPMTATIGQGSTSADSSHLPNPVTVIPTVQTQNLSDKQENSSATDRIIQRKGIREFCQAYQVRHLFPGSEVLRTNECTVADFEWC